METTGNLELFKRGTGDRKKLLEIESTMPEMETIVGEIHSRYGFEFKEVREYE